MIHLVVSALTVIAFLAASINNVTGRASLKADYLRWGFPAWWCYITAATSLLAAVLIAIPAVQILGLVLGGLIIVSAFVAVLRRHEHKHLPPLLVFTILLIATILTRIF